MKLVPAPILLLLALTAFAQAPSAPQPVTAERLCGRLQHVQHFQITATSSGIEARNLPHVVVNLYSAQENGECCAAMLATTQTGHWGSFNLKTKRLPGGLYWLEVQPNGRKYQILVRYAPKHRSKQECYDTYWDVNDKGDFSETEQKTIIVD